MFRILIAGAIVLTLAWRSPERAAESLTADVARWSDVAKSGIAGATAGHEVEIAIAETALRRTLPPSLLPGETHHR